MKAKLCLLGTLAAFGLVEALLWVSPAFADGGLETGQNPLTAWNSNPLPSLGLFLAAYLYLNGLNR